MIELAYSPKDTSFIVYTLYSSGTYIVATWCANEAFSTTRVVYRGL